MHENSGTRCLLLYPANSGARPGIRGITFPLGIGYVAAILKKAGYALRAHDFNFEICLHGSPDNQRISQVLREAEYDFLLIGGVFPNYSFIREIVRLSKETTSAPVIVGGSYLTPLVESVGPFIAADYYVLGEAEGTIVKLLERLRRKESVANIPGIAWLENGVTRKTVPADPIEDLDSLPFPDRTVLDFQQYKRYFATGFPLHYTAHLIGSRGCPLKCTFCNPAFGRKIRLRSPENIYEEMKALHKDFNCRFFFFYDEVMLGGAKKNVVKFCEYVLSQGKTIYHWAGTTNASMLDFDTLDLMKKAGCIRISFGLESGSSAILKEMKKKNDLEQTYELVRHAQKIGIEFDFSLLTNTFSETHETLQETKEYLLRFSSFFQRYPFSINFITPVPGTYLYEEAKERGLLGQDDLGNVMQLNKTSRYQLQWNLTSLRDDEIIDAINSVNKTIADRYCEEHPFQTFLHAKTNLFHFRFQETLMNLSFSNLSPFFEGLLWVLSRGDDKSKLLALYRRIVYRD